MRLLPTLLLSLLFIPQAYAGGYKHVYNAFSGLPDYVGSQASSDIGINCDSASYLQTTGSGDWACVRNVGIGTTSAGATLDVLNTGTGNSFRVQDQASDTTPFVIDSGGNVGIGNATPSASLDVVSSSILGSGGAGTTSIGGTTNYVKIGPGGELTLEGTATRFEDLRIEPVARTTGGNAPTFEKWYDDSGGSSRGVYLYSFDDAVGGSEKEIFFTAQMPHQWKLGSDLSLHAHWVGAVADTTATPRWGLEYVIKEIGEVFGDSVIIYSNSGNVTTAGIETDVVANKHYLSEFSDITPGATADGLSTVMIGRIFRDSASTLDTYNATGAKCGLLYIDLHYELDSMGSAQEYSKT